MLKYKFFFILKKKNYKLIIIKFIVFIHYVKRFNLKSLQISIINLI